ncbi:MAG: hypothetical protein Q8Q05_02910 [bacterium]|nr:hypothetical protein [bacterium]
MTDLETRLIPGKSYLYGGDASGITEILASFEAIDTLVFDGAVGDAKSARAFVNSSGLGAFGVKRLLLINNADDMSDIVQNTLLKLLEEPPPSVVIILQAEQPQRLLPTVLSRLHSLEGLAQTSKIESSHFQHSSSEMFNKLTELPREQLVDLLADEMNFERQQLLITPTRQVTNRIELLDRATKKLNANANLKLTIDWLLLHWEVN